MEQFVLGIFQEHLSKFVIGFRKEQVNGNLLNGKGEITDLQLNCSYINEQIRKVTPYVEFESVHISKLSFKVTSWTNLRQAPIIVNVGSITAVIYEPLHFNAIHSDERTRPKVRQVTQSEWTTLIQDGILPKRRTSAYNVLDRILDNLSIEIHSINITFQPLGKFKTQKVGIWTPPAIRIQLFDIRYGSVNEYGTECSPEEAWKHNNNNHHHHTRQKKHHHHNHREKRIIIYKRLQTEYQISLVVVNNTGASTNHDNVNNNNNNNNNNSIGDDDDPNITIIPLVSSSCSFPRSSHGEGIHYPHTSTNNHNRNRKIVEALLAITRRINNGDVVSVQMDMTIPVMDIQIDMNTTIPPLIHFLTAIHDCFSKCQGTIDPFKSTSSTTITASRSTAAANSTTTTTRNDGGATTPAANGGGSTIGGGGVDEPFPNNKDDNDNETTPNTTTITTSVSSEDSTDINDGTKTVTTDSTTATISATESSSSSQQQSLLDLDDDDDDEFSESEVDVAEADDDDDAVVGLNGSLNNNDKSDNQLLIDSNDHQTKASQPDAIDTAPSSSSSPQPPSLVVEDTVSSRPNATVDDMGTDSERSRTSITAATSSTPPQPPVQPTKLATKTKNSTLQQQDRPVLAFPNGIVIHEKLSISFSVHHVTIRGLYNINKNNDTDDVSSSNNDHFDIVANGVIAEAIWPTFTNEKGGYVQMSVAHVSIMDCYNRRLRSLIVGGTTYDHDLGPTEQPVKPLDEGHREETFPFYEDRSIRPDPIGLRKSFPGQAIGLKISLNTTTMRTEEADRPNEDVMVLTELGIDNFELVVDSAAWCRILRCILNIENDWFDPRWFSGDYSEYLPKDRLHNNSTASLFDASRSSMSLRNTIFLVMDILNATIRAMRISVRIPAPIEECLRSCDVLIQINEAVMTISPALPKTLYGDDVNHPELIEFPNDPSDAIFNLDETDRSPQREYTARPTGSFRCQQKVKGFSIHLIPIIPINIRPTPQQLFMSTDVTMIIYADAIPSVSSNGYGATLVLSVIVHNLELKMDCAMMAGAAVTLLAHINNCSKLYELCLCDVAVSEAQLSDDVASNSRMWETMDHRQSLKRLLNNCGMETESLAVVCCVRMESAHVSHWRQNVLRQAPLTAMNEHSSPLKEFATSVLLWDLSVEGFNFCAEDSIAEDKCRLTMKVSIMSSTLKICDFERLLNTDSAWLPQSVHVDSDDVLPTINLFSLGSTGSKRSLGARIEEQVEKTKAFTVSIELEDHAVHFYIAELETLIFLVMDGLLMPFATHTDGKIERNVIFPFGTIGGFLESIITSLCSNRESSTTGTARVPNRTMSRDLDSDRSVEQLINCVMSNRLQLPVEAACMRVSIRGCSLRMPTRSRQYPTATSHELSLKLSEFSFLASYLQSNCFATLSILDTHVQNQQTWRSMFPTLQKGLQHRLKSRQSIVATMQNGIDGMKQDEKTVLDYFDIGYSFQDSIVQVLAPAPLSIASDDILKDMMLAVVECVHRMKHLQASIASTLAGGFTVEGQMEKPLGLIDEECSTTDSSSHLVTLLEKFRRFTVLSQGIVASKDREVEELRVLAFGKERERLAALALASSDCAGPLRVGPAQQSGQRGLLSCMLWQYWAVLRRALLVLYPGPGQPGIVDIIVLVGAVLKELTGDQRKSDLRRAFAIIESSGRVHFIVTESDTAYMNWILALQRAIDLPSRPKEANRNDEQSPHPGKSPSSQCDVEPLRAHGDPLLISSENEPTSRDLTGVPDGALPHVQQDTNMSSGISTSIVKNKSDTTDRNAAATSDAESIVVADTTGTEIRTHQIRSRFAVVGQVTKSRFGSALSAAREKGKEVAQKGKEIAQKRREATVTAPDNERATAKPATHDPPVLNTMWPCPSCTFHNPAQSRRCQICSSLRSAALVESTDEQKTVHEMAELSVSKVRASNDEVNANDSQVEEGGQPAPRQRAPSNCEDGDNELNDADPNAAMGDDDSVSERSRSESVRESGRPFGMKERFGAVVRRAMATADAQRSLTGRIGAKLENSEASVGAASEAVRLQKIALGSISRAPIHPFGNGEATQDVSLKQFSGRWTVIVTVHSNEFTAAVTNEVDSAGTDSGKCPPPLDGLLGESIVPTNEISIAGSTDVTGSTLDRLDEKTEYHQTPTRIVGATFRVQVLRHKYDTTEMVSDFIKTLPEIAALHTFLSESVASIPSYSRDPEKFDTRLSGTFMSEAACKTLGLSTLDMVRITGNTLWGLLEYDRTAPSGDSSVSSYQADCISSFLNSVIVAPLPMDGLSRMVDFLGLQDAVLQDPASEGDTPFTGVLSSQKTVSEVHELEVLASEINRLSTLCEREIALAENQNSQTNSRSLKDHSVPNDETKDGQNYIQRQRKDAMHAALVDVLEERDQMHCRLVSESVLHAYEMEKLSEKMILLASGDGLDASKRGSDEKKPEMTLTQNSERSLQQDTEAELLSLCQQLTGEISARTMSSLEVIRLQESRKAELENDEREKQALRDEVLQLRKQLDQQRRETDLARSESNRWKIEYEKAVGGQSSE